LWAALIATINQKLQGRVGFVNPQLYALSSTSEAFHDITVGNNRVSFQQFNNVGYDAGPGWDAASGLGSPNGTVLSGILKIGAVDNAASPSVRRLGARTDSAAPKARRSSVSTASKHGPKQRHRK
jgi:hypothetical protein